MINKVKVNQSLLGTGTLLALVIGVVVGVGVYINSDESTVADAAGTGVVTNAAGTLEVLDFRLLDYANLEVLYNDMGRLAPAVDGANIVRANKALQTETVTILLELDGRTEYKAIMQAGDAIVYEWESTSNVYYDYHAHQPGGQPDPGFFTRYVEGEGTSDRGAMIAPYTGQHGWYFLNLSDGPVEIQLTVSGYYDELVAIDLGG
ncbi:MAG: hypothetical protein HOM55_00725 [Proteobacteria bacterium]|nr:hypothetical protein [Pseudomonadota bacterium]